MEKNKKYHYWLYVLSCEGGKYYVGITTKTPEIRMQEHINHVRAAKWTMKYKPLAIHDRKDLGLTTKAEAETYEQKITRLYMKEHGYNNVRGGDLTDLDEYSVMFGRIFDKLQLDAAFIILMLLACIVFLEAKIYIWK